MCICWCVNYVDFKMQGAKIKTVLGIFPMGQQPLVDQGPFMIHDRTQTHQTR